MTLSLKSLSVDAWRKSAFKNVLAAEKELATAETFIRTNDWEATAVKLEQAALSYSAAARAFREMAAGTTPELAS